MQYFKHHFVFKINKLFSMSFKILKFKEIFEWQFENLYFSNGIINSSYILYLICNMSRPKKFWSEGEFILQLIIFKATLFQI
jgi:hypothetical protein